MGPPGFGASQESFFFKKHNEKVFKNQCLLYQQFRTKKNGIKTGYMAYHDSNLFFVVYLAHVNMSILDKKNILNSSLK